MEANFLFGILFMHPGLSCIFLFCFFLGFFSNSCSSGEDKSWQSIIILLCFTRDEILRGHSLSSMVSLGVSILIFSFRPRLSLFWDFGISFKKSKSVSIIDSSLICFLFPLSSEKSLLGRDKESPF
uniref:Uncharacterized protein n=1 Tax=Lepeophtheirus salmonis TaxID=72036 RepID=A0A0K2U6M2_LEPSM